MSTDVYYFQIFPLIIVPIAGMESDREDSEKTQHDALAYGTGILLMTIANGMSCSHMLFRGMCVGVKVRVGVCNLVYQKVRIALLSTTNYDCLHEVYSKCYQWLDKELLFCDFSLCNYLK